MKKHPFNSWTSSSFFTRTYTYCRNYRQELIFLAYFLDKNNELLPPRPIPLVHLNARIDKLKGPLRTILVCKLPMNDNNYEGDMKYKTDRWTNKVWVEFYPPLALTNGIEVPLINNTEFDSYTQLEAHIKKNAVSGYIVSE